MRYFTKEFRSHGSMGICIITKKLIFLYLAASFVSRKDYEAERPFELI